jgi:putative phosphoribosyl transferase
LCFIDFNKVDVMSQAVQLQIQIQSNDVTLPGELIVPDGARGVVLFAHGSGSSRHSPRNQLVAQTIRARGIGTLLFDLLTKEEESVDAESGHLRFDVAMLAERLVDATHWVQKEFDQLRVCYFGSSTGTAAALLAAAKKGDAIGAVVSRGGRPDLAGQALTSVTAPTLLLVGGLDYAVIDMNRWAYGMLRGERELRIVPGASHLFEEPGMLEFVAELAAKWFEEYLQEGGDNDLSRSIRRRSNTRDEVIQI